VFDFISNFEFGFYLKINKFRHTVKWEREGVETVPALGDDTSSIGDVIRSKQIVIHDEIILSYG
jgi:hypothetical protein